MVALSFGWALRASVAAATKKGRKVSLVPFLVRKSSLARARRAATRVTSTSTTVVSWAEVLRELIMRSAMTWRRRLIFSVLPRSVVSGTTLAALAGAGATGPGPAAAFAAFASLSAFAASSARRAASRAFAAASTSCLRMRPPTPVPVTVVRSTPFSRASLRTIGVT